MPELLATIPDGEICDFIDRKFRKDTPEEYVRQNVDGFVLTLMALFSQSRTEIILRSMAIE